MEQRQWITRALDGDRTARAHLLEENIGPIYYLLWKLTGSAAQASDLTRRTFDRAFSHLSELRADASFERWVVAIAVNLSRQTLKKAQPWLFTTDEREMAILRDTYVAGEECLPAACRTDPEARAAALRTLSLLPPEQRVCMVLHYVARLKPHQIAKTMEVDEITVLGRLNSARRALLTALPSEEPQPLLHELFAAEAEGLSVPEVLHGSCMQAALSAEPAEPPAPKPAGPAAEPPKGLLGAFRNLTKQQKILVGVGAGMALVLLALILALLLRGCGKGEPEKKPAPSTPAPIEQIDPDLEAAALLDEYGVEMLLTCSRREADEVVESWQSVLPDYLSGGTVEDLDLRIQTANDQVCEVRLRLHCADLDLTRLRGLGLGVEPELAAAGKAIAGRYHLPCYAGVPLFDPEPRADDSLAAYSENYRYELIDENGDGRADALAITRTGADFDAKQGMFTPYGQSLTDLIGLRRADAEAIVGDGGYEGEGVSVYAMSAEGLAADGSEVTLTAIMQARSAMDAGHERVSALSLRVEGCFAALLPELKLPDSPLTLDQLSRKLQALPGHLGLLEGDVFTPAVEAGQKTVVYYSGATRYAFRADGADARVAGVEVLDLSDCRLWDASSLSFRCDAPDLERVLGLDRYAAYADYGLRAYATADLAGTALGLWEAGGLIRTVYNGADPRPLAGIRLGDSRESIEEKVERAGGYCCDEGDPIVRYVLGGKRELAVTYSGGAASILQLEDHSYQSDYTAPKPLAKSTEELFADFLANGPEAKASWYGDMTRDGTGDLLVCRASGGGCLLQLYVRRDDAINPTPIYSQSLSAASETDVYILTQEGGPCLLYYTLHEGATSNRCIWRLVSINASGAEVVLDEGEASVDLLDLLLGSQEDYDHVKEQAEEYREHGSFLCGVRSGSPSFADRQAELG